MKQDIVVCTECHRVAKIPKSGRTFLAAIKYDCPSCGARFLYPMTPGDRTVLWVGFAVLIVIPVQYIRHGEVPSPDVLAIFAIAIIAIARDWARIRKVRRAESMIRKDAEVAEGPAKPQDGQEGRGNRRSSSGTPSL